MKKGDKVQAEGLATVFTIKEVHGEYITLEESNHANKYYKSEFYKLKINHTEQ